MTTVKFLEVLVYLAIIIAITPILGGYMKRVFAGEKTFLDPLLRPVERGIYRFCGVDSSRDQGWVEWTVTMLIVNAASEVLKIPPADIEAPGSVFAEGESNYVTGVGKLKGRLIILLDVSKLLHRQEVKRLEEAAETVAAVK